MCTSDIADAIMGHVIPFHFNLETTFVTWIQCVHPLLQRYMYHFQISEETMLGTDQPFFEPFSEFPMSEG